MKYEWKLTNLKKQDDPSVEMNDIIVQTNWSLTGTDKNGNSGTFIGATPFEPDQIDPENFTTYENLTEETILGWIQGVVETHPGYRDHIDRQIQKQIDAIIKPVSEIGVDLFPWIK